MQSFKVGIKVTHSSEEFIKEIYDANRNDILLRIEHGFGCIDIVFNPMNFLLTGDISTDINDEQQQVVSLPSKDLHTCNERLFQFTSAIYLYISEAYKVADLFQRAVVQSR
jgi:hypothetical protein